MHWILSTPDDFSLDALIRRSQALILPPFHLSKGGGLERIERLHSGKTVRITISQASSGVQLRVNRRLRGDEREELSHKVWRMLRIGEETTEFQRLLSTQDGRLPLLFRSGTRFLRGATLLEDMVRAYLFALTPLEAIPSRITQMVERMGDPLPDNPTRHAFPTAMQLLRAPQLLQEIVGHEAGLEMRAMIASYLAAEERLLALERSHFSSIVVAAQFQVLPGVNDCSLALMMFALGRYAHIPHDLCPWERWHRRKVERSVAQEMLLSLCAPWQPWGGLIYLLWDWDAILQAEQSSLSVEHLH